MANEEIRKEYSGATVATTLAITISAGSTSVTLTSGATFPTGGTAPFVIAIGRETPSEEKLLVSSRAGNVLTILERGYDGTSAQAHTAGANVSHVLDAHTLTQANRFANTMTTAGDLVHKGSGTTFTRLPVGSAGLPLVSDGTNPAYAQLTSAGIADGTIAIGDLAAAVQNLLTPAGAVMMTIAAAAPTGWLFHNQTSVGAQTAFPALWAVAPASWKSGANLVIPDLSNRALMQAGVTALGASGGSQSLSIVEANLPPHAHTINHDHGAVTSGAGSAHNHGVSDPTHAHTQYIFATNGAPSATLRADYNGDTTTANILPHTNTSANPTGISINNESAHTHPVDLPNFTGNSGNGPGSGTAMTVPLTPHAAFNVMIKAH